MGTGGVIVAVVALLAAGAFWLLVDDGGLSAGARTWASERPDRYTMTIDCGGCPGSTWHVTVHGDEVIAMDPADQPLTDLLQGYREKNRFTIDRMYRGAIRTESERLWAPVEVDIDPATGVPYMVEVGPGLLDGLDVELGWTITEFSALD